MNHLIDQRARRATLFICVFAMAGCSKSPDEQQTQKPHGRDRTKSVVVAPLDEPYQPLSTVTPENPASWVSFADKEVEQLYRQLGSDFQVPKESQPPLSTRIEQIERFASKRGIDPKQVVVDLYFPLGPSLESSASDNPMAELIEHYGEAAHPMILRRLLVAPSRLERTRLFRVIMKQLGREPTEQLMANRAAEAISLHDKQVWEEMQRYLASLPK